MHLSTQTVNCTNSLGRQQHINEEEKKMLCVAQGTIHQLFLSKPCSDCPAANNKTRPTNHSEPSNTCQPECRRQRVRKRSCGLLCCPCFHRKEDREGNRKKKSVWHHTILESCGPKQTGLNQNQPFWPSM